MKTRPDQNYNFECYKLAAEFLTRRAGFRPEAGLVLGSALGSLADAIQDAVIIPYEEIPFFPASTVESHAGKMIFGKLAGRQVVCMSGRFHYYEGYDFEDLVIPMRVLALCGVRTMILTNAAGAVNESYRPGDIMVIRDHIKLMGASPLRGPNLEKFGPRFFDVSDMYTGRLRSLAIDCARELGQNLQEGVYYFAAGPQFETPAEIRAMRILGADAVGMSTVTEALTCAHAGVELLALSLITNMAAGITGRPVTGEEVDLTGADSSARLSALIMEVLKRL